MVFSVEGEEVTVWNHVVFGEEVYDDEFATSHLGGYE